MRIACPFCGERGNEEFAYLGDATVVRPDPGAAGATQAFADYLYLRNNVRGLHRELWYHAAGCHGWLVVTRENDEIRPVLRDHAIELRDMPQPRGPRVLVLRRMRVGNDPDDEAQEYGGIDWLLIAIVASLLAVGWTGWIVWKWAEVAVQ